jgi:hypothetical protein
LEDDHTMTSTNKADAFARWQLEQGDPEPMRKRLKEQEDTQTVAAYLENCELLDEYEDAFEDEDDAS